MTETIITIVGSGLTPEIESRAAQIIKKTGVEDLRIDRLNPGIAIDIFVPAESPALTALFYKRLSTLGAFDIFVQPNDAFRKKKIFVADMDATMVQQETLDELAAHFNLKDKIAPITEKAMRGEIDFQDALKMRIKLLQGLPLAALYETIRTIRYSAGAIPLIKTMRRAGTKCVLVSGGFDLFTSHVAETLGFHKNVGNRLEIEDHKLTGGVIPPIVDKHVKEQLVIEEAKAMGCDLKHVLAIGDGANDIPMLQKAGIGVGYFGKPAVVEATPCQIRHTDLLSVLYLQGYRQAEIAF